MEEAMDISKINEERVALVTFIGDEHDYTIYDAEAAGCGNCAMCDEVPRDACTHHGAAHRVEFTNGDFYLAYGVERLDDFVGIAVMNNDDELVFPRDARDFEVVEDRLGILKL